ncbi:hypothetical protein [Lactiplantibacillus herbarum]|uniref:hypothetical protein n=1 Tax=Lactiplantibacillus herbarum TaxID=1670446 RepID=UPI00064E1B06|nr:hypothetical protein [Lactiplantibacillus herbarum]
MTNRKLWQLLWRHYRTLLLVAGVLIILAGIKEGFSAVHDPKLYLVDFMNQQTFAIPSGGNLRVLVTIVVSFVLGLVLFLSDNFTNFDQYLFSLPVTRRWIYRRKVGLLVGTLTLSYVLMEGSYLLIIHRILMAKHIQINWTASLYESLESIAIILTLSLLAATFGLWVGHVMASALAGFIFSCSLVFAYNGLINIVAGVTGSKYHQVDVLNQLNGDHWSGLVTIAIICLGLSAFLYWLNQWAFEKLSLENSRDFFRFPQLRMAVLVFAIVYLIVAISCSQFGLGILGMITDHYREQMPLPAGTVMTVAVAYLTWSLGRWFLYRPDKFRDVWTFKRLE